MPKRTDISTILIIGAGPIVIGQACEFDYSGTQAVKTLKEEGYRIVLVNSNPATIMTDPELADATYIEPITPEIVAKIIEKERHVVPGGFALLPTMGGQTALNCALSLRKQGTLSKFDVEMIGATAEAIDKAEDRGRFRQAMTRIGLETPRSTQTKNLPDALRALDDIGLPAIIRPSFTMGGTGGGIAYTKAEFIEIVERGIDASPTDEVLIEESVLGWKEFETEVVRDKKDNCIIVCSIENLDPMGVHTGDSITVAPALTLTDKEYQIMRDASLAVLREIGVETGGSNVQFGVNPADGRMVVIEMNPRVSRSSALASKATGFPIAKIAAKLAVGFTLDELRNDITRETPASFEPAIDYCVVKFPRWAFENIREIVLFEREIVAAGTGDANVLRQAKQMGFADRRIAELCGQTEAEVRAARLRAGITATFKMVDTCAAEFVAHTPYLYSTYEEEDEAPPTTRDKVVILGSGPNRIGQGIEFDYACVHAAFALKEAGVEAIMVNCNPETVSTDYDTSDRLYFEPLTFEDVMNIVERERPRGVIVQFGGQTPLKLTVPLERDGVSILGTPPDAIDRAEDRQRFAALLAELGLQQAPGSTARSYEEAERIAQSIGYPVLVRPSYVLGGRAMQIVYDREDLQRYMTEAVRVSPEHPILVDKFLEDALEIDVDAIADGERVVVGGVMEHVEKAGIHSGDSACALPPYSLGDDQIDRIKAQTRALAKELDVLGLLNIQFAIKNETVYVLEVNPRASRTVPFVSKAIGVPLAKLATKVMLGASLRELGFAEEREVAHLAVKEAVFPFIKFPGVDVLLGPEMKSTGEVMGIDRDFRKAYVKSQIAANSPLPTSGKVFLSVKNRDKRAVLQVAKRLAEMGFSLVATAGTAKLPMRQGMTVELVYTVNESLRPNIVDLMKRNEIALVFNTPEDGRARKDSYLIRRTAVTQNLPSYPPVDRAPAAIGRIEALLKGEMSVQSLQDYYAARP